MFAVELTKPDGRRLTLYARAPIGAPSHAPSPFPEPLADSAHLRWHPLRGEWVTYAAYRQGRTSLPPPEYNPLAPTVDASNPTEVPGGDWDIAVFDNRFPSLGGRVVDPPRLIVPTAPANGHCEVVVFTKNASTSLGALALSHIELLLQVARLGAPAPAQLATKQRLRADDGERVQALHHDAALTACHASHNPATANGSPVVSVNRCGSFFVPSVFHS